MTEGRGLQLANQWQATADPQELKYTTKYSTLEHLIIPLELECGLGCDNIYYSIPEISFAGIQSAFAFKSAFIQNLVQESKITVLDELLLQSPPVLTLYDFVLKTHLKNISGFLIAFINLVRFTISLKCLSH